MVLWNSCYDVINDPQLDVETENRARERRMLNEAVWVSYEGENGSVSCYIILINLSSSGAQQTVYLVESPGNTGFFCFVLFFLGGRGCFTE